jgi:hypothetical protein
MSEDINTNDRTQTQLYVMGLSCIISMECLLLLTHDCMKIDNGPNNLNILVMAVLEER